MAETSSSASGSGAQPTGGRVVASSVRATSIDIEQLADRVYRLMREDLQLQLRRAGRR